MKYSIIIPCYNVKDFISECLDSVIRQTFHDWEAICIDDGSPDGLGAVLDDYAKKDARIKVIHQANSGVGMARNAGIEVAHGDWIAFLDGDDVYAPYFLEFCERGAALNPTADMIRFRTKQFNENEKCQWKHDIDEPVFTPKDISKDLSAGDFSGPMWSILYNRKTLGKFRFKPLIKAQDTLYLAECVFNSMLSVYCNATCMGYRLRGTSITHTKWNYKKIAVCFAYGRYLHAFMLSTKKKIDRSVLKLIFNGDEFFFDNWKLIPDDDERVRSWNEWLEYLREEVRYSYIPAFHKIRITLFLAFRTKWAADILFGFPVFLKKKGLHR